MRTQPSLSPARIAQAPFPRESSPSTQRVRQVSATVGPWRLPVPLRTVRYTLFWQDRIFTMWLYLCIVLLTLVLALIPWGFLLHYGTRLVGLAIFGPRASTSLDL